MTLKEIYKKNVKELLNSGDDCADTDCILLMEKHFGADRQKIIIEGNKSPDDKALIEFEESIKRRKSGVPLQYILGVWQFCGLDFKVGEGVLIPREDTKVLLDAAMSYLKGKTSPKIVDLCAGSGTIAITAGKHIPDATVWGIELSKQAYEYFLSNIALNGAENIKALNSDIFTSYSEFKDNYFDVVVSNPPYIRTNELSTLQREVQFEPISALDGGEDGLYFYRKIIPLWKPKLKSKGLMAFEISEDQYEDVKQMLEHHGFFDITLYRDINGLKRAITGIKK